MINIKKVYLEIIRKDLFLPLIDLCKLSFFVDLIEDLGSVLLLFEVKLLLL